MQWPSSSSAAVGLPWQTQRKRPVQQLQRRARARTRSRRSAETELDIVQAFKYAVGMAGGVLVVGWLKRRIQRLPVVGVLATPFLALMPSVLVGSAVGAAVVYGIDEGDPLAVQKKVLPRVRARLERTHAEISVAAADAAAELRRMHSSHVSAARTAAAEAAAALEAAAAEADAVLLPAVERSVARIAVRAEKAGDAWAAAVARDEADAARLMRRRPRRVGGAVLQAEVSSDISI